MSSQRTTLFILVAALAVGGCTAITGFGGYTPRGDTDGGQGMDADTPDSGNDGGVDRDGAVDEDGGMGGCDPACEAGEECVEGSCMCGVGPSCASGNACCDGSCTDVGTISNCGACGNECPMGPNFTATCNAGTCDGSCNAGFDNCDGATANGCEQSLIDPEHCGACENACAGTELCAAPGGGPPSCVSSCGADETECSGACVDTNSSPVHCGGCGNACPSSPPGATGSTCSGGTCRPICRAGFDDCDGNPMNGCEMLRQFWPDGDRDGYGNPTGAPMTACVAPANFADNDRDCDDTQPGINPGASEVCNGLDDNCDTRADETFTCALGDSRTCTMTISGCTGMGVQDCTTTCGGFGSCVLTESCDRTDTDCDGFVDEAMLGMGTSRVVVTSGVRAPRAAWGVSAGADHIGLVYESAGSAYFQALLPDGSTVGGATRVGSGPTSWDVAYTGSHFLVAIADRSANRIELAAFSPTGVAGATSAVSTDLSPNYVRLDRIGTTDQLALLHTGGDTSAGHEAIMTRLRTGSSHTTAPAFDGTFRLESSGGPRIMSDPAVVRTTAGAFLVFAHYNSSGGVDEVPLYRVVPGSSPNLVGRLGAGDGFAERDLELAYDPNGDLVALLYRRYSASGAPMDWTLETLQPSGGRLGDVGIVSGGWVSLASAGDGNFAVVRDVSGGPQFERYRASDLTAVRGSLTAAVGHERHLVGIGGAGSSSSRYVAFSEAGTLSAQPVVCR